MLKKLLLALFIMPVLVFAQARPWKLVTPIKRNSNITSITMLSASDCFMVDASLDQTVLKTSDGGATWERMDGFTSAPYDVYMRDTTTGFLCLGSDIVKTTDGFETIETMLTTNVNLLAIDFPTQTTGYAVGGLGRIYKSMDSGTTWTLQESTTSSTLREVHFIDELTGFACGGSGLFLKTIDGGVTWASQTIGTEPIKDINFSDALNGVAVGSWGTLRYTTNGGITWSTPQYTTLKHLNKITRTPNKIVVAGDDGLIITSTDNGVSWTESFQGTLSFYAIASYGNDIFTGGDGILYKSADEAQNWTVALTGIFPSNFRKVSFADNMHGVAVGNNLGYYYNAIYITEDGGNNWIRKYANTNSNSQYVGVHLRPDGVGAVCGGSGVNMTTSNFGNNWQGHIRPNTIGRACWAFTENEFLIGGGGIWRTENGVNWEHTAIGPVTDIYFPTELTGYTVGGGSMARTTDGGLSWTTTTTPSNADANSIFFLNEEIGYIGTNGIYKTTDAGVTWTLIAPGNNVVSVYFYDELTGFAAHSNGQVSGTTDGGETWATIIRSSYGQTIGDAAFLDGKIIAVGKNSDIYMAEITTPVLAVKGLKAKDALKVYPNPANTFITVETARANAGTAFSIYSVSGQLLKTAPSKGTITKLDISDLSAGVYIIKTDAKDAVSNTKFVKY